MLLHISKWFLKIALFAPLIITPLFIANTFTFPGNGFFPFISMKAIYFRSVVEIALFFFIAHLLFSTTRKVQWAAVLRRLKKPIALAVMAFAFILLLSGLLGENPAQSIWSNFERGEGVFQIIHYCVFFLLIYLLYTDKKDIQRLIRVNLIVSFLICLYAMAQLINPETFIRVIGSSERVSGTLGNPSYLAAYLLINFAFIAYTYLQSSSRKTRGWLIALATFQLFTFINTGTRAAYIALAVGLLIIYCTHILISKNPKTKSRLTVILIGALALGAMSFSVYQAIPRLQNVLVLNRLFDIKGAASGFAPRIWTWGSALQGISERPMLGWGAENFPYSFDKHYNPNHYGIESFFDRTHNALLEYLITGGIALLLAYLAMWYFYYRALRGREKNTWYSILIAMPVMILVQGFFLFDVLPIYLMTFLFLALTLNMQAEPENTSLSEDGYGIGHAELLTGTGLLALLIFSLITTGVIPWKKNQLITHAYSMPGNDPQASFNAFQDAIMYPSLVGQEEAISGLMKFSIDLLDAATQQQATIPTEIVRGIVDTNNQWFDSYKEHFTGARNYYLNGGLNLRAGLSFGLSDYTARGKQLYDEVLAYAPKRIEFIQLLMEVARATNDVEEFERLFSIAKELRPDYPWQALTAAPVTN